MSPARVLLVTMVASLVILARNAAAAAPRPVA